VPPGALLAGYLLLLREAARSDAVQARRRAEAIAAQRRAARERARDRSGRAAPAAAGGAAPPEEIVEAGFSAQIIDISARVTDQFYDQYTDATTRAVGD
jgi:hypothetical protein